MKVIKFPDLKKLNDMGYIIHTATINQIFPTTFKNVYQLIDNNGKNIRPIAIYHPNSNKPYVNHE